MPKRNDIKSVLVIGAGPIVIGQACEFDYSGTQACKALREEGLRVILVNSNPATIMTDTEIADATYIEPLTTTSLEKIIVKERPDTLLSTVGGQTGLNCALNLWNAGILKKYGVEMIGANPKAIEKAENRALFNQAMAKNGLGVPKNATVSSLEEALKELDRIGLPAVIRPSFTLGGAGGGIAENLEQFKDIVSYGLDLSPTNQVLIDESIVGWKEYEMEVVRDINDNAIIVCSIENIDPMGVHTGDSVTVAPALTLTDKEYQALRDASIAVLREVGVETGGSNVQFAINPKDGRIVVIEMNPRVSRSSALASKATGFPIAKVAAKLAIGYTLDEIKNDITRITPASFEPSIDYVVTKIPRFNFEKFNETTPELSSSMRSVGEVMSIGRSFAESLQKGLCSLETGLTGLNSLDISELKNDTKGNAGIIQAIMNVQGGQADSPLSAPKDLEQKKQAMRKLLRPLAPDRILRIGEAFRSGLETDEIHEITKVDPWFLREIKRIVDAEEDIKAKGLPQTKHDLLQLKKLGFSDARIATLAGQKEEDVYNLRNKLGIHPVFKTVDTCAAEFESQTSYLYSCYEGYGPILGECESNPSDMKKIVILGSGPNRIGQGIEFDYTCVHAAKCLSKAGFETIMINCNPETVSTDYDTSNKLYFEPLYHEHVIEAIRREQTCGQLLGVIVHFGGQTPLKLSQYLQKADIPILGTSPDSIDLAENRDRFRQLLSSLNLKQPKSCICNRIEDIPSTIEKDIGFPVMVRPSNVLGGRAMVTLYNKEELNSYLENNWHALTEGSILIDRFLENAIEIDVDAISDGKDVYIAGIMEHIERAGIHSGDSACVLPPYSLSSAIIKELQKSTVKLAMALKIKGPINIQYAIKDEKVYVIEANPRASRTIPFVSKTTGVPLAKICSEIMVGKKLKDFRLPQAFPNHFAVKEVVLPFARFPQVDTLLGPEMKSTGESMGHDKDLPKAFAKAQIAAFNPLPAGHKGVMALVGHKNLEQGDKLIQHLQDRGFRTTVVGEMSRHMDRWNNSVISFDQLLKESEKSPWELIQAQTFQIAFLTESDKSLKELRRLLVMGRVSYFSTWEATEWALESMKHSPNDFEVTPIQSLSSPGY